ncbi:hypothetical protein CQ10_38505 [Bradyrhizobium valentinum]|nr:hypothetical protein CQ10_38505 [Bradyrhizobium valentinum]
MHRREANGDIDVRPWCQGFYAAMRLKLSAWAPLLDASNVDHRLLLPILRKQPSELSITHNFDHSG